MNHDIKKKGSYGVFASINIIQGNMDKKELKKAIKEVTEEYGFKYVKKGYYYMKDDLIIVLDLQKSDYKDAYYLNYGYLIKGLQPDVLFPKTYICDISGRIVITYEGSECYCIQYSDLESSIFKTALKIEINETILPVIQNGLINYYKLHPEKLYIVSSKVKQYLGL